MDNSETLSPRFTSEQKPLRILIILNLYWDSRLGAARVYMELAEQWRAAGHAVEHFSLSDAFPGARGSRAGFAVRQVLFAYKAAAFVKRNAARFDIIDAVIGSLPASKKKLGYDGLLVARSLGLYRLYDRFERNAHKRWPDRPRGKFFGRILYRLIRNRLMRAADAAVRHSDLVNVPNKAEAGCLQEEVDSERPIIVQPYGLTVERCQALEQAPAPAEVRLARKRVSFVGMWAARKGSHDWATIMRGVWQKIPGAQFCFFGTMVETNTILSELRLEPSPQIELISDYLPDDLPALLADCAVGAFPSYVEGFGLAVLEQLAAGIPTVAFDVPGPRDILSTRLPELLVTSGDLEKFVNAICQILELDLLAYQNLSARSTELANQFRWERIAEETLATYRNQSRRAPIA